MYRICFLRTVILDLIDNPEDAIYIDLFCGACGVLRYMAPLFKKSYANDLHKGYY